MSELDPADTPPAGPQDTQSSDQSQSKLRAAWDAWTSRPENNAFLLQTGIALLQPHSPGQTQLGAFANSIGSGAEAADRNVAAQRAEADAAAKRDFQDREAGARETTANAYSQSVRQQAGKGINGSLAIQKLGIQAYNKWLNAPEDTTGFMKDGILQAIQKQFPDVKSKGDLLANPAAAAAAKRYFQQQVADEEGDTTPSTPSPAPATPQTTQPSALPPPRMLRGRAIHVDPQRRIWVFDDGTPAQ